MKTVTQEEFIANAARLLSEARESGITIGLVGKDGELRMTIHPSARVVDSDCPNCDAWKEHRQEFKQALAAVDAARKGE